MRYITIQECHMQNAILHKMRMEKYLLLGMYNHACGSFRKYHKKYDKATCFTISGPLMNVLANNVARSILYNK